jgi:hypothetical protein
MFEFRFEKDFQQWLSSELKTAFNTNIELEKSIPLTKYKVDIWIPKFRIVIECKQSLEFKYIRKQKYKHLPQLKYYAELLNTDNYYLAYACEAEKIKKLIINDWLKIYN